MANTTIQIRRTATAGNVPNPNMIVNGELILNFADGNLFYRTSGGTVDRIGSGSGNPVFHFNQIDANGTLLVSDATADTATILSSNGISITGDGTAKTVSINLTATGVTPNIYGGNFVEPVITLDSYGRITAAANSVGDYWQILGTNLAGSSVTTAQPWFPQSNLTVESNKTYRFRGQILLSQGTTSHSTRLGFSNGTCSFHNIAYQYLTQTCTPNTIGSTQYTGFMGDPRLTTVSNLSTQAARLVIIDGIMTINVGGTFRPEYAFSAAPGTPVWVRRGTYIWLEPLNDGQIADRGPWT